RRRLLRDVRHSLLFVAVSHSDADLWHRLHPDARTRRIPFHSQYRAVLDIFLPRFHSKVERWYDQLTGWRQRRPRLASASSRAPGLRLHLRVHALVLMQYVRRTGLIARRRSSRMASSTKRKSAVTRKRRVSARKGAASKRRTIGSKVPSVIPMISYE